MKTLRTTDHIASRLALSKQRLWELVRKDFFPEGIVVKFGRTIRFNEERLEDFLENGAKKTGVSGKHNGGEK